MEFSLTFWVLVAFFGGFWYGSYVSGIAWKKSFKDYRDELHRQYVEALSRMKEKFQSSKD